MLRFQVIVARMISAVFIIICCLFSCISCNMPTLSRGLERSGFHREISTVLLVPADLLPPGKTGVTSGCRALFKEVIPSSAYVDPFQLAALKDFGGPDYLLTEAVNVESPEYESTSFTLYIFGNLTRADDGWVVRYNLPVHLRYHAVADKDHVSVTFANPEVSLRCKDGSQDNYNMAVRPVSSPCDSTGVDSCEWFAIQYEQKSDGLHAHIPVGRAGHYLTVTVGTILATILGCLFLGYSTVISFHNSRNKIS